MNHEHDADILRDVQHALNAGSLMQALQILDQGRRHVQKKLPNHFIAGATANAPQFTKH
ncbi:MAG TPA: hypothetical protein PLC74_03655 [Acetobacteraceae bacterium]|jgi:hypothetical protein|nr:hypothetical protein [Acetobacteraceae bacterium]